MYAVKLFALVVIALTLSAVSVEGRRNATLHKYNATIEGTANRSSSTCYFSQYTYALQTACGYVSIHGLWPNGDGCNYCTSEKFDESSLSSDTLAGMNKYWKSCEGSNSNTDFWSHEWSRHGTCSGMDQESYFATALQLFNIYSSGCSNGCELCIDRSSLQQC